MVDTEASRKGSCVRKSGKQEDNFFPIITMSRETSRVEKQLESAH